jgi:Sulfotransferase family
MVGGGTASLRFHGMSAPRFSLHRYCRYRVGLARSRVTHFFDSCFHPEASHFYADLIDRGFDQLSHIDVLPRQRVVYLCIPKCASTTIRMALSAMIGHGEVSSEQVHLRRQSGLRSPKQVGASTFYRLVKDESALRFSFVRNPYDRLVSAWADKFQDKPLAAGDPIVDIYLEQRRAMDLPLPKSADETLSFADFVHFTAATADRRIDVHWQSQDDILNVPGIAFDFIGKLESFDQDFARVIEHVGASSAAAAAINARFNKSRHRPWRDYYTGALAAEVYRTYERDFDRLGYTRNL